MQGGYMRAWTRSSELLGHCTKLVCAAGHRWCRSTVPRSSMLTDSIIIFFQRTCPLCFIQCLKAHLFFLLAFHLVFTRLLNWRHLYYPQAPRYNYRFFCSVNYQAVRTNGYTTWVACLSCLIWLGLASPGIPHMQQAISYMAR